MVDDVLLEYLDEDQAGIAREAYMEAFGTSIWLLSYGEYLKKFYPSGKETEYTMADINLSP